MPSAREAPADVVALVPRVAAEGAEAGLALNLILTLALTLPLSGAAGAVGAAHSQRQATSWCSRTRHRCSPSPHRS